MGQNLLFRLFKLHSNIILFVQKTSLSLLLVFYFCIEIPSEAITYYILIFVEEIEERTNWTRKLWLLKDTIIEHIFCYFLE